MSTKVRSLGTSLALLLILSADGSAREGGGRSAWEALLKADPEVAESLLPFEREVLKTLLREQLEALVDGVEPADVKMRRMTVRCSRTRPSSAAI